MYWANEQKCRKLTIIFCQSLISIIILFSAFLAYAIYCICCGNLETSTWLLPFNMIVPFDTETIVGWFFLWFLQLNMSIAYMACIVATTTYFCCCCLYLCAICEHFAIHFQIINRDIDQFHANELGAFEKFNKKLAEKVRTAIGLHVKMLKWVTRWQINGFKFHFFDCRLTRIFQMIEEINSGGILSLLPINAMYMSLSMYVLESVRKFWRCMKHCCHWLKFVNSSFFTQFLFHFCRITLPVWIRTSLDHKWDDKSVLLFDVAISDLPFCNSCHWSSFIGWQHRVRFKLGRVHTENAKVFGIDHASSEETHPIYWIQFDFVRKFYFCKSMETHFSALVYHSIVSKTEILSTTPWSILQILFWFSLSDLSNIGLLLLDF